MAEIHSISEGTEEGQITLSADDFLPLFVYVILQSVRLLRNVVTGLVFIFRAHETAIFFFALSALRFFRSFTWRRSRRSTSGVCSTLRC